MTTALAAAVRLETPDDDPAIEQLCESAFGPGRFARAAFRLRESRRHEAGLSFVAAFEGELIGSVRLTAIVIGATPALLLGPLVVDPAWKDRGYGKLLVRTAVAAAREAGHRLVILVGDAPYYGPLGFRPILPPGAVRLPGPVDPARLLVAELEPGVADGLSGTARAAG